MKFQISRLILCCLLIHPLLAGPSAEVENRRQAALGTEIEDFQRADGRTYQDVRITAIDDGGTSIRHAYGTARLRYSDLTKAQKTQYGISKSDAQSTYRQENEQRADYEQAVRIEEQERALRAALEAKKLAAQAKAREEKLAAQLAARPAPQPSEPVSIVPVLPEVDPSEALTPRLYSSSRYSSRRSRYGHSIYYGYSRKIYRTGNVRYNYSRCRPNYSRRSSIVRFR